MLEEIHAKYMVDRANISIYTDKYIRVEKIFRDGKSRLRISASAQDDSMARDWEYRIDMKYFSETVLDLKESGISVTVRAADYEYFEKFHKNKSYIFLALENDSGVLYIRNRRRGDRLKTVQGTKKIKDMMIEKKLDSALKDRVPLIVAGGAVAAWMPGFLLDLPNRVSVDFMVDKNSKKVIAVFKN
jgi:tRNA(Ile)-lysidine synthetase-like protein